MKIRASKIIELLVQRADWNSSFFQALSIYYNDPDTTVTKAPNCKEEAVKDMYFLLHHCVVSVCCRAIVGCLCSTL